MSIAMSEAKPKRANKGGALPLTLLGLFFAAFITIDVSLGILAANTFPGEIEEHPYLVGINYNETLAAQRAQAERGWRAGAALQASAQGTVLEVVVADKNGARLDRLQVGGVLERPTNAHGDKQLMFTSVGGGVYHANLGDLPVGGWRLRARAVDPAGHALDFERSFTWRVPTP